MTQLTQTYGVIQFGNADALTKVELTLSQLDVNKVRIKLISSSVNPIDAKTRQGLGFVAKEKAQDQFMPLGYDAFGIIEQVGESESDLTVGQHVIGMVGFAHSPGCYSTYLDVCPSELIVVNAQETAEIAGLCLAGLTALQALRLFEDVNSKPIFITAPTGGVGHLAIQIAKTLGLDVIALTTRPAHPLLKSLNVKVLGYDDFYKQQHDAALLDLVGGERGLNLLNYITRENMIVTVPTLSKDLICAKANELGQNATGVVVNAVHEDLKWLYSVYKSGKINVHQDESFSLENVSDAHHYMENNNYCGKIIITA
ncbi:NADPH2:quinone reductase [Pseudoalteromonas citrea]|uniref:NADPH2:quinone reductase n=2 Tax=Pseudoalteromonas citrea TaxID=43655 RepID=A0AAD4FTA0_9GAMM|nr:NADP-dependent oxidoreductase [Pseudoalteromonas citrea]KAF7774250.1 NADPH2:quinone reductase [Pseudoalteromonas citrea]